MTKIFLFTTSEAFLFNSHAFRMKVVLFTCKEGFDELTSTCRRVGFHDPGISSHSLDITRNKKKKNNMILRKNPCPSSQ